MDSTRKERAAALAAAYGQKAADSMIDWDQMGPGPHIIWINDAPVAGGCMLVIEGFSLFRPKLKELGTSLENLMKKERKGTLSHKAMKERLDAIRRALEMAKNAGKTGPYVDVARCHNCNKGGGVCSTEKKLEFLACSRCKCVHYCGKLCQTQHWPKHRKQCGVGGRNTNLIYNRDHIRCVLTAIGRDMVLHGTCYDFYLEFVRECRPTMEQLMPAR